MDSALRGRRTGAMGGVAVPVNARKAANRQPCGGPLRPGDRHL